MTHSPPHREASIFCNLTYTITYGKGKIKLKINKEMPRQHAQTKQDNTTQNKTAQHTSLYLAHTSSSQQAKNLAYYSSIILYALGYLLFPKLCWPNLSMPTLRMAFNGGVLDLCNRAVSEKNPQIFLTSVTH